MSILQHYRSVHVRAASHSSHREAAMLLVVFFVLVVVGCRQQSQPPGSGSGTVGAAMSHADTITIDHWLEHDCENDTTVHYRPFFLSAGTRVVPFLEQAAMNGIPGPRAVEIMQHLQETHLRIAAIDTTLIHGPGDAYSHAQEDSVAYCLRYRYLAFRGLRWTTDPAAILFVQLATTNPSIDIQSSAAKALAAP